VITTTTRETAGCAGCGFVSVGYYDGLGRVMQTRAEDAGGQQRVSNTKYDGLGRTIRSVDAAGRVVTGGGADL
jgi:YD repeat-containing protein